MARNYDVNAEYSLSKYGLDYGYGIEKAVGEADAAGAGFGVRDMSWSFKTKKEATAFMKKLKTAYPDLTVALKSYGI